MRIDSLSSLYPDAAQVKARVDLADYVSQFTRLRPSGRQFVGICPLHRERHPSFFVDPGRQIFFCHGCQRGGDVFSFVMYQRDCGFPDAVRAVAQFAIGDFAELKPKAKARLAPPQAVRPNSWARPHRGEPKATFASPEPRPLPPCFFDAADLSEAEGRSLFYLWRTG